MKKTWITINETLNRNRKSNDFPLEIIVNNESITDTMDIANHFNNFFSNIGTNLSSSIKLDDKNAAFTDYLHNPTDHRFTFSQINEREVLSIINKLKYNTLSGKDGISNKLLKSIKSEISEAIAIIINQSILTGIFPDQLNLAKVKPLYTSFQRVIDRLINTHFKMESFTSNYKNRHPWLTGSLRSQIKAKNRMYTKAIASGSAELMDKYKKRKNEVLSLLKKH